MPRRFIMYASEDIRFLPESCIDLQRQEREVRASTSGINSPMAVPSGPLVLVLVLHDTQGQACLVRMPSGPRFSSPLSLLGLGPCPSFRLAFFFTV